MGILLSKNNLKDLDPFCKMDLDLETVLDDNKSIANNCVIPCHCKHFHSPIFYNSFLFSVSPQAGQLNLMGHGTKFLWNNLFVMIRHFITDQLL